ncbi:GNAT superfamily N-acetyltransferase [Microbacterium sp. W4I4]|uniref:GNAT family N-acetyltransferase n=1 Tax=Microbacterium sp. W4I4 TaxID=3042295 RepID=UPI00277E24D1|nr:GNAT family N-acetyltransferase [Microbacterium sp. W4I4]MDQ0612487.1 GNAT superfamily N-acetyltransferase [Microbacterium sp. W4I4]
MSFRTRPARAADASHIEEIESAADRLLVDRFRSSHWPAPDAASERFVTPGFLLVAESSGTIAGFVHVLELDGHAHLEQVSVLPRFARRGMGRMLVQAAMSSAAERGHTEMTLRTYADVPWNAPFYASCGFTETAPETEALRRLIEVEERLGLFEHGRRIQMTASLASGPSSASPAADGGVA